MMNLKNYVNSAPTILTIAPTYKCTATCKECCFRCTSKVEQILETDTILQYIDEAVASFPSLKIMILTGGECFLIAKELPIIISRAKSNGLMSRVVSNGFWATSYETAVKKLSPLVDAGLTELNISTGDNHQEYVPFENVVNGFKAAYDLGIKSMAVSVESPPNAQFKSDVIRNHPYLSLLINKGVLSLIDAAWMKFSADKVTNDKVGASIFNKIDMYRPCKHLYNSIVINPYSQMLACCGLTVEYNKFLKLGKIGENNSILDLYNNQFSDLFKFWLHVDGPAVIYDKIASFRKIEKKVFPHECQYCIELVHDEKNIDIIKAMLEFELSDIIFRYSLRKASLKIE